MSLVIVQPSKNAGTGEAGPGDWIWKPCSRELERRKVGPTLEGVVCNLARLRCAWAKLQLVWRFTIVVQGSKWVYFKAGPFGCD